MTGEFDRVRDAFASSAIGGALLAVERTIRAAWHSSFTATAARSIGSRLWTTPAPDLLRALAAAVAIAALVQPLLIVVMPRTVRPALPWAAYALTAAGAALTAWQAEAIVTAWPASRLARWIRR